MTTLRCGSVEGEKNTQPHLPEVFVWFLLRFLKSQAFPPQVSRHFSPFGVEAHGEAAGGVRLCTPFKRGAIRRLSVELWSDTRSVIRLRRSATFRATRVESGQKRFKALSSRYRGEEPSQWKSRRRGKRVRRWRASPPKTMESHAFGEPKAVRSSKR